MCFSTGRIHEENTFPINIFDMTMLFHGQTFNLGTHLSHQLALPYATFLPLKKKLFIFFSGNNVHRHIGSSMHVLCYVGLHNLS